MRFLNIPAVYFPFSLFSVFLTPSSSKMSPFRGINTLIVSAFWYHCLSFEFPPYCHVPDILNGTACCQYLNQTCEHDANTTRFNCTHGTAGVLPTGTNLLHLQMSGCGLNGNIPENITLAPYLQSLDLSLNNLVGTIPQNIGEIGKSGSGLKSIDLSLNFLEGTIPVSIGLDEMQLSLTHLDLSDNYLTRMSMASLVSLTALEYLDLSNNQISETYHETLHSFSKLKVLNLGTNRISGSIPFSIAALTDLEVLNMERNDLTGTLPGTLSQIANLKTVNISDNKFEGAIPSEWSDHWTSGALDHLNLGYNLFDCPVHDYSAWGQDNDYTDSYGTNGRTNCQSTSSSTSSQMTGVEVAVIVIVAIIFVVLIVYCWRTSVQQKRRDQVAMLTEEDVFDDD